MTDNQVIEWVNKNMSDWKLLNSKKHFHRYAADGEQVQSALSMESMRQFAEQSEKHADRQALLARLDEHKKLHEVTKMSINPKSQAITSASFMLNVNDFQKYRLAELQKELENERTN